MGPSGRRDGAWRLRPAHRAPCGLGKGARARLGRGPSCRASLGRAGAGIIPAGIGSSRQRRAGAEIRARAPQRGPSLKIEARASRRAGDGSGAAVAPGSGRRAASVTKTYFVLLWMCGRGRGRGGPRAFLTALRLRHAAGGRGAEGRWGGGAVAPLMPNAAERRYRQIPNPKIPISSVQSPTSHLSASLPPSGILEDRCSGWHSLTEVDSLLWHSLSGMRSAKDGGGGDGRPSASPVLFSRPKHEGRDLRLFSTGRVERLSAGG